MNKKYISISALAYESTIRINSASKITGIEYYEGLVRIAYYDSEFTDELDVYKFNTVYIACNDEIDDLKKLVGYTLYGTIYNTSVEEDVLIFGKHVSRERVF